MAPLLSRCSVLQSKQRSADWCWQNHQRDKLNRYSEVILTFQERPPRPTSPVEITRQLFLLTCTPWETQKVGAQGQTEWEKSDLAWLNLQNGAKYPWATTKRSTFKTAHTGKNEKGLWSLKSISNYLIKKKQNTVIGWVPSFSNYQRYTAFIFTLQGGIHTGGFALEGHLILQ